jgi:AraC-like DNA-binding protein
MASMMPRGGRAGLERSCAGGDWFKSDISRPGFERVEANFATHAFSPHRHDTYTIGITTDGVQAFGYRGAQTRSGAGQLFVLHPDELHDGRPGAAGGYRYRTLYVEPRLIQEALDARSLPFVRGAVTNDTRLRTAILAALEDPDVAVDDLHFDHSLVELAEAMAALDPSCRLPAQEPPSARAVNAAREFLDANLLASVSSWRLERVSGLSRFALTRHFHACLGTSPHRYVIMRRLDRARDLIRAGTTLAEVAGASGFADQAHMTRHFKKAYGVSPARWRAMQGQYPLSQKDTR